MANKQLVILPLAARTASINSAELINTDNVGAQFVVAVTAVAATPTILVVIQGKDPLSGNFYSILSATAITAPSTNILSVFPGITVVAGASVADIIPRVFRVQVIHIDADSITYSISGALVG